MVSPGSPVPAAIALAILIMELKFQVLARSRGVKYRTVPYRNWHYDLPALAAAITPHTTKPPNMTARRITATVI